MQHQDGRAATQHRPQRDAFVQMRHEERVAAGIPQRRGHFRRTQPVGVGLDHRRARRAADARPQRHEIGPDRREVDGQDAARPVSLRGSLGSGTVLHRHNSVLHQAMAYHSRESLERSP